MKNKYRLSFMIVFIIMLFMYMMDIVEITEETNFAFTLAALILSASMAVDTFAKQNQIAQAITFIMEICALLVIVLFPNLKSFIFLKKNFGKPHLFISKSLFNKKKRESKQPSPF